jgi:serine/threonine protein kinase
MAAPQNTDEFIEIVRKSGIVPEAELQAFLQRFQSPDIGKVAGALVRDGLITIFQGDQLLQGKFRRFSIGQCTALQHLGSGLQCSVYLCADHDRGLLAMKVLPARYAADLGTAQAFHRTAIALARLQHHNIVQIKMTGKDEPVLFIGLEFVDGSTLADIVNKHGPMDLQRACHYIRQAAEGLQYMHVAAGLVHREIEPANIMIDRRGTVRIVDFGLARSVSEEPTAAVRAYDESICGVVDFMAPEQAANIHRTDIRADIYGLGAVFYFLLTGRPPHFEQPPTVRIASRLTRDPTPIRHLRPDLPPTLATIIERMMMRDPAQRFQLPIEVVTALEPSTRTPIAPPDEKEMPRHCPAVLRYMQSGPQPDATRTCPRL